MVSSALSFRSVQTQLVEIAIEIVANGCAVDSENAQKFHGGCVKSIANFPSTNSFFFYDGNIYATECYVDAINAVNSSIQIDTRHAGNNDLIT